MSKAASIAESAFGGHSGSRSSRAALIETLARNDVATTHGSLGGRTATDAAALARDIAGAEERGELLLRRFPNKLSRAFSKNSGESDELEVRVGGTTLPLPRATDAVGLAPLWTCPGVATGA